MKNIIGEPQPVTYCPNRNMILLSIAASYAETVDATHIAAGMVELDNLSGYWDCTEEFVERLNKTLALNRMKHIEVVSPLVTFTKKDIILRGIELGVKFDKTRTCYTEHEVSCGECPSCAGRIKGWIQTKKYKDSLVYKKEPDWNKFNCTEFV
jgi:7-cyano-7-deazaguanine synthase